MALLALLPIFGYAFFIHLHFKKLFSVSLFVAISFIMVVLFLFGMVSLLQPGAIVLFSFGVLLLLFELYRDRQGVAGAVTSPPFVVFTIMSIAIFIAFQDAHLFFWDEYSHWGIFIKEMFFFHHFYDAESVAAHLNYPPGISVWDYFVLLGDRTFVEGHLYFAYFLLLFSATLVMYEKIEWKSWHILLLVFAIQMMVFAAFGHGFSNIYVDHVIGAMFAGLILSFLAERYQGYQSLLLLFPLVGIVLVKEVGLYFGFAAVGLYLIVSVLRQTAAHSNVLAAVKSEKKSIAIFALSLVLMAGTLKTWELHQRAEGISAEKQSIGGIIRNALSEKKAVPGEVEAQIKEHFWQVVLDQQIHKEALSLNYNEFSFAVMPHYKKRIKLSTIGFIVFFLLMVAVAYKVAPKGYGRKEAVSIGIYLLVIYLGYLAILYMSYLVAFGNGGVRIPSYVRYINMASMPLLFAAFSLLLPMYLRHSGSTLSRQKMGDPSFLGGLGLLVLLTWITQPYLKPLYSQLENGFLQQFKPAADRIVKTIPAGAKLYVVFPVRNNGMLNNIIKYELVPAHAAVSQADFTSLSPLQMQTIFSRYDYVWFAVPDKNVFYKNRHLLQQKNDRYIYTLYQVVSDTDGFGLKPLL